VTSLPASPPHAAAASLVAEPTRRRTFAIISHPDAGKTTLSEKLLLYAGAVAEAGAVKARRGRRAAVSDWMDLERERGISITSAALRFSFRDTVFNMLDTPGHRDFSEDTLRVLAAADSAVMLIDAAKGIEGQTLKLFHVARARRIPLFTFVNKYDRPGRDALALLDELEQTLHLRATPLTWPVGIAGDFRGVVDRRDGSFHRFARSPGGATPATEEVVDRDAAYREGEAWEQAREELALLDAVDATFDRASFLVGESIPVFFGSALSNFGVRLLLDALIDLAPGPGPLRTADGGRRELEAPFSGLVFKVQSNLDPRHRDRLAFLRVCSGRFERGMKAVNERTGRVLTMSYAHRLFGQERETIDEAYPGDVVGVVATQDVRVGDTLFVQKPVSFPRIPTLAPEHFAFAHNRDAARYKQFRRGLSRLDEEGVVHVLRDPQAGGREPIVAGVGPMQFEVATHRLAHEFGTDVELTPAPWRVARRIDAEAERVLLDGRHGAVLVRADGTRLAAFMTDFDLERFARLHPDATLDRFLQPE
jgi:peptide chain release factor 3